MGFPRTTRLAAAALALTTAGTLAGCMATGEKAGDAGTGAASGARLKLDLTWVPKQNLSPYSDDALSLTRSGAGETLVSIDSDGKLQPWLAESFQIVDAKKVRFTLRKGVKFQDGTAADAKAVADSLTHAMTANPGPESLVDLKLTAAAVDDSTVEVTSADDDPLLAQRFANPALVILAAKAYTKNAATPDPVGTLTGAYTITKVSGTQGMTSTAFAGYWGGTPKLAGLDVRFVGKPEARASALRAGESDVAENIPLAQLAQLGDFGVLSTPTPRFTGVFLTTNRGAFADAGARSAAAKAVNAQAVFDGPFEKHGELAKGLFRDASWTASRPAVARAAAATPPTAPITIATYSDRPELPDTVSLVADQLRKAGFTVNPPVVKSWTVMEKDILAGTYDVVVSSQLGFGATGDPVSGLKKLFTCKGSYNVSRLCDPKVDAAVAAAGKEVDETKRLNAALTAEKAVLDTGAVVPLVFEDVHTGYAKKVTGLTTDLFGYRIITPTTAIG